MSVLPAFDNAEPVTPAKHPIVLRFAGLHPHDLGRFTMHDKRRGGDLSHVDLSASDLNEVLLAGPKWQEVLRDEVKQARHKNHQEEIAALLAKSRKKEANKVREDGPVDPWQKSEGGALREGILTVNKAWFGGTGHANWDPKRVEAFKLRAMDFLEEHFPDGELRFASAHADEESLHIHFVVAVWRERITANRGRQILLQASMNPLLASYEHAQTLAGEAFAEIGLKRGECRAEARRAAKAAKEHIPEAKQHVAPSEWRAREVEAGAAKARELVNGASVEAKTIIEEARTLAETGVRKSRMRAVEEARQRNAAAGKEVAEAERLRDRATRRAEKEEARAALATASVAEAQAKELEIVANSDRAAAAVEDAGAKLVDLRAEADAARAEATTAREEVEVLSDRKAALTAEVAKGLQEFDFGQDQLKQQRQELKAHGQRKAAEEAGLSAARAARITAEGEKEAAKQELAHVKKKMNSVVAELNLTETRLEKAREDLSIAELMVKAVMDGLDLVSNMVLRWRAAAPGKKAGLDWEPRATKDREERQSIIDRIKPGLARILPLARGIGEVVEARVKAEVAEERASLCRDAASVAALRDDWEQEKKDLFARILAMAPSRPDDEPAPG